MLPATLPNLLLNGTTGIAVGMATNIPPHNPSEVIDGVIAYMDDPDISTYELMQYIKGPDFRPVRSSPMPMTSARSMRPARVS